MIITDQKIYDGPFIHKRFAYEYFRNSVSPTGNIVTFVSPTVVEASGMIDKQDILDKDYIYSDKMINFCWEIPCIRDCFGAVAFQRLFNSGIANILTKYIKSPIIVDGDDIMVIIPENGSDDNERKASVSITHMVGEAAIGHTGINIDAGSKAPYFAYSTHLDEAQTLNFIKEVESYFTWMTRDMFVASAKVF